MTDSTQEREGLTVYEVGYLVLPSLDENKVREVTEAIKAAIDKEEGKVFDGEEAEMMDLAYTMTKTIGASRYVVNEAYVGWLKFEAEPSRVLKIKGEIEKMDEILRFLLIKAPKETTFTFAEARKKLAEKENEGKNESEAPSEDAPQAPVEVVE